MSIVRKLAITVLMAFGLSLLVAVPATASESSAKDKQGEIKVCKVLKDAKLDKYGVTFDFVVREKAKGGDKDRKTVSFTFTKKNQDLRQCDKVDVGKGAYVVRERGIPKGYALKNIEVRGCFYKDRNDRDAKIQVDVKKDEKCTVIFTNKKA